MASVTITTPAVLRAVVSLRQWTAKENTFCSSIMEEPVTNLQFMAVIAVCFGLALSPFIFGTMPLMGLVGVVLMVVGSMFLEEEDSDDSL